MSYMKNLYYDIGDNCRYEDGRSHSLCGSYFGREFETTVATKETKDIAVIIIAPIISTTNQLELDLGNGVRKCHTTNG